MTPELGEGLSRGQLERLTEFIVAPGSVFRLHVPHSNPPKIKRIALIAVEINIASVAFLFINSDINQNLNYSSYLRALQYPLSSNSCSFLDHDSFLDCARLYEWSLGHLRTSYIADPNIFIGTLTQDQLTRVKAIAASAKTIERKLKKRYKLEIPTE